jgi:esterase/lipase
MHSSKRRFVKYLKALGIFWTILIVVYFSGPTSTIDYQKFKDSERVRELRKIRVMSIDEVDKFFSNLDLNRPHLNLDLKSRILWPDGQVKRYSKAVLFLHGFSASPLEFTPLTEQLSSNSGVPIISPLFSGHGQDPNAMLNVKAEDWLFESLRAYEISKRIADHVDVIGSSTGATLAYIVAAMGDAQFEHIVLMSPNFGPKDSRSELITGPWSHLITQLILGPYYSWDPVSELQAKRWLTRMSSRALPEMMSLVKFGRELEGMKIPSKCLMVFTPHDTVVSVAKLRSKWPTIDCQEKKVHEIDNYSRHVLAGESVATPEITAQRLKEIEDFFKY